MTRNRSLAELSARFGRSRAPCDFLIRGINARCGALIGLYYLLAWQTRILGNT
jgi:hypothetical protein